MFFLSPSLLRDELPESAYKHQLLGLNLLFLLSQNRVAEFHTELERLPSKEIQTNVYIKHPVSLEQVIPALILQQGLCLPSAGMDHSYSLDGKKAALCF